MACFEVEKLVGSPKTDYKGEKKCLVFPGTVGKFNDGYFLDLFTTIEAWFVNQDPFEHPTMKVEDMTVFERGEQQLVDYHYSQAKGTHLCP